MKIDQLSVKILKSLVKNGRKKYTTIAKELGVSEATVRARVKSLIHEGYIKNFTVTIDPFKVGYKVLARIGIDADMNHINSIVDGLKSLKEIYLIALSTGTHDILVDVIVRNLEELKKFLTEKLGKINGIKNFDVSIIMEVYKSKVNYSLTFEDLL